MTDVATVFKASAGTGEILKVAYHGGRQPGAVREITVRRVDAKAAQVFCLADKSIKRFDLDKISLADDGEPVSYVANASRRRKPPAEVRHGEIVNRIVMRPRYVFRITLKDRAASPFTLSKKIAFALSLVAAAALGAIATLALVQ